MVGVELDMRSQMILEEYREKMPVFEHMKNVLAEQLGKMLEANHISALPVQVRIKTEESLTGKLHRKGYKYTCLSDITDIVGARIIVHYIDEVDKISAFLDKLFDVDWDNSVDKRKIRELDRFGYVSLHYICRIPASLYSSAGCPELNEFRFEVQMRTILQHAWASLDHDTGYKSVVEIPKEYKRAMIRLAGLLELADEQFAQVRSEIDDYRRKVQSLVKDGNFKAVSLDGDTYRNYIEMNPFKQLIEKIASINHAEIYQDSFAPYLNALLDMGFTTLGDIEQMKESCSEGAYQLALHTLAGTDLDIVAASLALQNMCVVHIYSHGGTVADLQRFYNALNNKSDYNEERAMRTMEHLKKINII